MNFFPIQLSVEVKLRNLKMTLTNTTINICSRRKFENKNFVLMFFIPQIEQSMDKKLSCPIRKVIEIKNFK